jgi:iron complex outermembrane receptor protein
VDFDGPGPAPPVAVFGGLHVERQRDDVHGMARYQHAWGAHDLTLGINAGLAAVEGSNSDNDAGQPGTTQALFDNYATNFEIYALDRWAAHDQWTVVAAVQASSGRREVAETDVASDTTVTVSETYTNINPRLGVLYHVTPQIDIFANVSRLFEPPTLSQVEDEGAGEALDAMSGTAIEIGTRGVAALGEGSDLQWDVTAYYSTITDEILSVEDPAAPGTAITGNVERTIHAGLEAAVSAAWDLGSAHRIEPAITLTWNYFRFDDDALYGNNTLPGVPETVVRMDLLYRHERGFFAGPTIDVVGRRYADFTNSYAIDSYALLGLRGGWERDNLTTFVEVRNVLDEDYIASSSIRADANPDDEILNPGEPVSVYAGIKVEF